MKPLQRCLYIDDNDMRGFIKMYRNNSINSGMISINLKYIFSGSYKRYWNR